MAHPSLGDADRAFRNMMSRFVDAIRAEAGDRTCGGCAHAYLTTGGNGHCTRYVNLDGGVLHIHRADALACRDGFEPALS